jgi:hypothetical protein
MFDKFLANIFHFCSHFFKICKFQERKGERIDEKKGADVNEGKFVLNIDFIMDLKHDGLCVYETTIKTRQHIIS